MSNDVVIVAAKRTPIGAFQGVFNKIRAPELGSIAIRGILEATDVKGSEIDEVFMGCVLSAGLGQAPARQALIGAGISTDTPATTVNKVCGSGMKAIMLACDQIRLGHAGAIVAGGMESMTNAPYLLDRARGGYRLGHGKILDHMYVDGLEDAYDTGKLMGVFAENTADKYKFARADQDAFAMLSLTRAQQAQQAGSFSNEIVPVSVPKGDPVTIDETPTRVFAEKIPLLRPAFREGGTVTAANSSSIADGAAAIMIMSGETAKKRGLKPLARILGYTSHAQEPQWFTTAPVGAIRKLCQQIGYKIEAVDLFEINEAFAVVTMAAIYDLKLSQERVNIWGGACALGHPIGASGTRLVVTLLHALQHTRQKVGIASLCIGGGESTAMAVELISE